MNKKHYENPNSKLVDLVIEKIIATSVDAGGNGSDMPWGTNHHHRNVIWDNSSDQL